MKLGDKVKVTNKYSNYSGRVGILTASSRPKGIYHTISFDNDNWYHFVESDLELVEVAHYEPVAKFKKGDTVWFIDRDIAKNNGMTGVIVDILEEEQYYQIYFKDSFGVIRVKRVNKLYISKEIPLGPVTEEKEK